MNTLPFPIPDENSPAYKLYMAIYKAKDAISRAEDNFADNHLSPASCAYIDGQLARAIGNLASARAIAVTVGSLDHPHFDGDEATVDLDAPALAAISGPAQTGKSKVTDV